ncbi:mitogen-activated protein kinase kinase kinase kinase 4-like [Alosa alosa]|uniref:mitogen-activated protein kinase kinase kinase kinase 4-like n=1 Tax=Alosa alosa TaxID=278164 RepID=UPI0020151DDA|nr:mitogen-activated protein kinase kinase kinase kinase 4-like [Alosa alosa]
MREIRRCGGTSSGCSRRTRALPGAGVTAPAGAAAREQEVAPTTGRAPGASSSRRSRGWSNMAGGAARQRARQGGASRKEAVMWRLPYGGARRRRTGRRAEEKEEKSLQAGQEYITSAAGGRSRGIWRFTKQLLRQAMLLESKWRELEEQRQAERLQRQVQEEQAYLLTLQQQQLPLDRNRTTLQHLQQPLDKSNNRLLNSQQPLDKNDSRLQNSQQPLDNNDSRLQNSQQPLDRVAQKAHQPSRRLPAPPPPPDRHKLLSHMPNGPLSEMSQQQQLQQKQQQQLHNHQQSHQQPPHVCQQVLPQNSHFLPLSRPALSSPPANPDSAKDPPHQDPPTTGPVLDCVEFSEPIVEDERYRKNVQGSPQAAPTKQAPPAVPPRADAHANGSAPDNQAMHRPGEPQVPVRTSSRSPLHGNLVPGNLAPSNQAAHRGAPSNSEQRLLWERVERLGSGSSSGSTSSTDQQRPRSEGVMHATP